MKKSFLKVSLFTFALCALVLIGASFAEAQTGGTSFTVPINTDLPIPNQVSVSSTGPVGLVANAYSFAFLLAGFLAFIMIVYGGVLYTFSAGNTSTQTKAKEAISQAIYGLLLLLLAYLILRTINPDLTTLKLPVLQPYTPPTPTSQATLSGYGCIEEVSNPDGSKTEKVICSSSQEDPNFPIHCRDIAGRCTKAGSCILRSECKAGSPPPNPGPGSGTYTCGGTTKGTCPGGPQDCRPIPCQAGMYACQAAEIPTCGATQGLCCTKGQGCAPDPAKPGSFSCQVPNPSVDCGPVFGVCKDVTKECLPVAGQPPDVFACQTPKTLPPPPTPTKCGPKFGTCDPGTGDCKEIPGQPGKYACVVASPPPPTACTVATPLPPVTGDAVIFEQAVNTGTSPVTFKSDDPRIQKNLDELLKVFNQFQAALPSGASVSVNSAYRSIAYQRHFFEICDRYKKLINNKDLACKAIKDQVTAEKAKHGINAGCVVADPNLRPPHVCGKAMDINLQGMSYAAADTLLRQRGINLKWKRLTNDEFHFELITVPSPC